MSPDPVKPFIALRSALAQEKARLWARLVEIQPALAASSIPPKPAPRKRRAPVKNSVSLKQAVVRVISTKPMKKEEILRAVHKGGYRFTGKNPHELTQRSALYQGQFPEPKRAVQSV